VHPNTGQRVAVQSLLTSKDAASPKAAKLNQHPSAVQHHPVPLARRWRCSRPGGGARASAAKCAAALRGAHKQAAPILPTRSDRTPPGAASPPAVRDSPCPCLRAAATATRTAPPPPWLLLLLVAVKWLPFASRGPVHNRGRQRRCLLGRRSDRAAQEALTVTQALAHGMPCCATTMVSTMRSLN
jgi:hypothetical protein